MISFVFALLTFLGAFMQAPAMDSDPAPAAAASASASWEADTASDEPEVVHDCTPWLVPDSDEGFAQGQELQAQGWFGDPTDGMEALYAPGC